VSELPDLDPALVKLFADERATHAPEPMARAEVLARIERTLRLASLGGAAGVAAGNVAGNVVGAALRTKAIVALAVTASFGAGVALGRGTAPERPREPPAVVTAPAVSSPVSAVRAVEPAPPPPPPPPPPTSPVAVPASASVGPTVVDDLAQEQVLVDTARAALSRGRAGDALVAVEAHAKRFPRGRLVEEREALAVQALASSGRLDEAKARAAKFHSRFPSSIFWPAVERSVTP